MPDIIILEPRKLFYTKCKKAVLFSVARIEVKQYEDVDMVGCDCNTIIDKEDGS